MNTCQPSLTLSWDVGPAHIISFSTELYFFLQYGMDLFKWQYEWLENDLKVKELGIADATV